MASTERIPAGNNLNRDGSLSPLFASGLLILTFLVGVSGAEATPAIDLDIRAITDIQPAANDGSLPARVVFPEPSGVFSHHGESWARVWLQGAIDPQDVERLGGRVGTVSGPVMTVAIPLAAIGELQKIRGLELIQLSQPVAFQTDLSVPEIGADELWGGVPPNFPPSGTTGDNVIVGIVDTGIDVTHADFKSSTGKTRVAWLWDQNYTSGSPPAGYDYGAEFSNTSIDAGAYSGSDTDGHGTLVAGVAAGNGRGTGNGEPQYVYTGVAPEADLVVVSLGYDLIGYVTDAEVMDGVAYVFNKAAQMGRPAVVLVAAAKMTGPHDGQDPLDLGLSALTGPGKIIVAPAGNQNGLSLHGEFTSTGRNQIHDIKLSIPPYSPAPSGAELVNVEAWYESNTNYTVSVVTPSGYTAGPIARGGSSGLVQTNDGMIIIENGTETSAQGDYKVYMRILRGGPSWPELADGTWTYRFKSETSGTNRVDAWMVRREVGTAPPVFVQGVTESRLVSSPATADNVIAVGAYSTKKRWTSVLGQSRLYSAAVVGDIAYFSSPGPRRDGAMVPDVVGPGYGVVGANSAYSTAPPTDIVQDGVHRIDYGTSIAAAHVAGTVALLLQDDSNLTVSEVRAQLELQAQSDSYTGVTPNSTWGYGKLRAQPSGATAINSVSPGAFRFAPVFPNPVRDEATIDFNLSPEDIEGGAGVRLRILDVAGRQLATVSGIAVPGPQRLFWDGLTDEGRVAPAGIYFASLEVGSKRAARKFVRLQ